MTTTLRYRVVAPAGVYLGETFHPRGSVLSLTDNAARYLLLSGIVELNSIQAPTPPKPDGPTEDDIRIVITIANKEKLVSLTDFIKLVPSFDLNQARLDAAISRLKGEATSDGDTLGEVEKRIRAVERIIESGGGSGEGEGPRSQQMPAAETILSLRVVRTDGSAISHASHLSPAHLNTVIGMSLNASQVGKNVAVQFDGLLSDPIFDFGPGVLWLGQGGSLTQRPPTTGFLQKIATAISKNSIMISLEDPIVLG